ncbi:MAG: TolC family protein [Gemmataceae bacterium]|nr:TolC family protein [Gemmataceae bacterium]
MMPSGHSTWRRLGRNAVVMLTLCLLCATLLGTLGCTRRFFRSAADREVDEVLAEKDVVLEWKIENYHVYPDPRARFADPSNPDRPPMPPDDPAASMLSPNPQKPPHRGGIDRFEGTGYLELLAAWDAHNRGVAAAAGTASEPEAPLPKAPAYGADGAGELLPQPRTLRQGVLRQQPYLLTLEQAVELGLINSREYQTKRENLYLVALPVTFERFSFAYQYFATGEAFRAWAGRDLSDAGHRWRLNGNAGFTKLFSTGALLMFDFANRTVLELGGTAKDISISTINLDLVQPLLQGGGRAVTLEPLTQAERDLLYEIRGYARFRKEYYQYITAGGALTGAAGAAPSEGYLSTVQRQLEVKIEEDNVRRLESSLKLYRVLEEGDQVSKLQVDEVQLELLSGQTRVLQLRQAYGDALDRFKLQLGVPPPVPLELDTSLVRVLLDQYDRYELVLKQSEALSKTLDRYEVVAEAGQLRERAFKLFTDSPFVEGAERFRATIDERWNRWKAPQLDEKSLTDKLDQLAAARRKLFDLRAQRQAKGQALTPEEQKALADVNAELALGGLEHALRRYESQPWKKAPTPQQQQDLHAQLYRIVRIGIVNVLSEARNERLQSLTLQWPALAGVPIEGIDLTKADLEESLDVAVSTALTNRLDLMNARAQVVDAWRQVAVSANSLLGAFDIGYHMDSTTPPGEAKPLAFTASRTRHELFFNAELPLVRLAERNTYRAALIEYQRARRALMAAEDQVAAQLRAEVRQLQVLARNYEIQKLSVELQFQNVEGAAENVVAPQQPAGGGGARVPTAAEAAALTENLLRTYSALANGQRDLLNTWIQYQVARQQLYVDLEMMPLDSRGVWIDEYSHRTPDHQPVPEPQRRFGQRLAQRRAAAGGTNAAAAGAPPPSLGHGLERLARGGGRRGRRRLLLRRRRGQALQRSGLGCQARTARAPHCRARRPGIGRKQRRRLPRQAGAQEHRHHDQMGHRERRRGAEGPEADRAG